jgi:hypothetical protein
VGDRALLEENFTSSPFPESAKKKLQIRFVSTGDARRQAPDGQNYALSDAKEVNIILLKVPFHDQFFSSNLQLRFCVFSYS